MRSLAPTHTKQIEAMNNNVQTKSQSVQAKNSVPSTAKKARPMTVQVECFINSKVLYWTTGLATGVTIGIAAFVAWKMVRDWKRK